MALPRVATLCPNSWRAWGKQVRESARQVPEVARASVAAQAGLRAGDVITAIDGRDVPASSTAVARVVRAIVYVSLHNLHRSRRSVSATRMHAGQA